MVITGFFAQWSPLRDEWCVMTHIWSAGNNRQSQITLHYASLSPYGITVGESCFFLFHMQNMSHFTNQTQVTNTSGQDAGFVKHWTDDIGHNDNQQISHFLHKCIYKLWHNLSHLDHFVTDSKLLSYITYLYSSDIRRDFSFIWNL